MTVPTAHRALWLLIVVSLGLRLVWAELLPAGNDEAYHYLFTVNPDWSYFDHPPMTMLVERLGLALSGGAITTLSLRLGFILMFAGSTWVLFRWTARWYGDWAGFYAALALNLTAYYTAAAGAFALPDGPLLFFSLLTLWKLSEVLVEPTPGIWPWVWVGLAWAGALLSKYHAIFLPAGALLYILVTPRVRRCLSTPGPYVATLLGLCGFLPVIIWNVQNEWASFAFQAGRAVGMQFRLNTLLTALGGPMLYLFPWIWLALVLVLLRLLRKGTRLDGVERLLVCQSIVPLSFFLAVSCVQTILPHWPLIGFLPLYPALGRWWAELMVASPSAMRLGLKAQMAALVLVASVVMVQACLGVFSLRRDPTLEMLDWTPVAEKLAELKERGLIKETGTFFFTRSWYESGHLAFAMHNQAPVVCYDVDARGFAFWSRPGDWLGQDGILLSHGDNTHEPKIFRPYFRNIKQIDEFPVTRAGRPVGTNTIRVFYCSNQYLPFPFRPRPPAHFANPALKPARLTPS